MERELAANGGSGRMIGTIGSGSISRQQFTDWQVGSLEVTGNPMDFALEEPQAMFAVQVAPGNPPTIRFTRDGAFQIDSQGYLVTKHGHRVLDPNLNPISIPRGPVAAQSNGNLEVAGKVVGQLGVFSGSFTKQGQNLCSSVDATAKPTVLVRSGTIERSNVNAIEAMVGLISASRSFELAQRQITHQDDLTQRLIQTMNER
jgi:flagellar basal-body rod protein FlgG